MRTHFAKFVLQRWQIKRKKASVLLNVFRSIPQILENVTVKNKNIISLKKTKLAIKKAERLLAKGNFNTASQLALVKKRTLGNAILTNIQKVKGIALDKISNMWEKAKNVQKKIGSAWDTTKLAVQRARYPDGGAYLKLPLPFPSALPAALIAPAKGPSWPKLKTTSASAADQSPTAGNHVAVVKSIAAPIVPLAPLAAFAPVAGLPLF